MLNANRTWKGIIHHWQLYLILLLPIVYLIIFAYIPMFGIQLAFKDFLATKGIWRSPWVGLKEFQRFFRSPSSLQVIWNTASIGIYSVAAGFPMPILLAIALNETKYKRFANTIQMVTYTPYFISTVVMVSMILQVLDTRIGIVALLAKAFGFKAVALIGIPKYFSSIYVWSGVWQYTGYFSIIYVASLAGVNPELQEASKMIPWLMEAGIDGIYPLERQAGVDVVGLRREYPGLLMMGGFDKMVMWKGEAAMRTEFERLLPVMKSGGYVPCVDHQTPPQVSLDDYKLYLRLLKEYCSLAA